MTKATLRHLAREWAMQYLYQRQMTKEEEPKPSLGLFCQQLQNHLSLSNDNFLESKTWAEEFVQGVVNNLHKIDEEIIQKSQNWTLERIALVDLTIMRLATYELLYKDTSRSYSY